MSESGIGSTPAQTPVPTPSKARDTCAIAPARGDVTTMRAAAAVRVRKGEAARGRPTGGSGGFPVHLLRAGPA